MWRSTLAVVLVWALLGFMAGAEQVSRAPVYIRSNAEFTEENGVVAGRGIPGDPYIIEGWCIDADGGDYGILIQNTSRSFVIRNVSLSGARRAGLRLVLVRNGTVENVSISGCKTGLSMHMVERITLRDSTLRHCDDAVRMLFSSSVEIKGFSIAHARAGLWASAVTGLTLTDSVFRSCDLGIRFDVGSEDNAVFHNAFLDCRIPAQSEGGNRWDDGTQGNYWQDTPTNTSYLIPGGEDEDRFPLAESPLP